MNSFCIRIHIFDLFLSDLALFDLALFDLVNNQKLS